MNSKDIIESGNLELFVYGLLSEEESQSIVELSQTDETINKEITSIEKSLLVLSSSFSPALSVENFEKIKMKLTFNVSKIVSINSQNNWTKYLGWAASIALFAIFTYQFQRLNRIKTDQLNEIESLNNIVNTTETDRQTKEQILNILRDKSNNVVQLEGQATSPSSYSKIYWNQTTSKVYVDATGLPTPPKGKVYQIWALKLSPSLTPTSIGLLSDFEKNDNKFFEVENANDAEAFGITLEPEGGSLTPTLEQLYTLGKV